MCWFMKHAYTLLCKYMQYVQSSKLFPSDSEISFVSFNIKLDEMELCTDQNVKRFNTISYFRFFKVAHF